MKNILLRIFMVLVVAQGSSARVPDSRPPEQQAIPEARGNAEGEQEVIPLHMEDYDLVLGSEAKGVGLMRIQQAPYTAENFLKFQALSDEHKKQFLRNRRAALTKLYWLMHRTGDFVAVGSLTKNRLSASYQVTKERWQVFKDRLRGWVGRGPKEVPEATMEPNIVEMARIIEEEGGQSSQPLELKYAPVSTLKLSERIRLRAQQIISETVLAKDRDLWSEPRLGIDMNETAFVMGFCALAMSGGCNLIKGGAIGYAVKIVYNNSTQELKFTGFKANYKPTVGVVLPFLVALGPIWGVSRSIVSVNDSVAKTTGDSIEKPKVVRTGTAVSLPIVPGFREKYDDGYFVGSNWTPVSFPSIFGVDPFTYVARVKQSFGDTRTVSVAKPIAAVRAPLEYCVRLLRK